METIYRKLDNITEKIKNFSVVVLNEDMNNSSIQNEIKEEIENFSNPEQISDDSYDIIFEPSGNYVFIFKHRKVRKIIYQKGIINAFLSDDKKTLIVSSREDDREYTLS